MLPLPQFLIDRGIPSMPEVRESLRLTGYFLQNWVCPAFELPDVPEARKRLIRLSENIKLPLPDSGPEYTEDEIRWLEKYDAAPVEPAERFAMPEFASAGTDGVANPAEDR
jgi:hypothetical protein